MPPPRAGSPKHIHVTATLPPCDDSREDAGISSRSSFEVSKTSATISTAGSPAISARRSYVEAVKHQASAVFGFKRSQTSPDFDTVCEDGQETSYPCRRSCPVLVNGAPPYQSGSDAENSLFSDVTPANAEVIGRYSSETEGEMRWLRMIDPVKHSRRVDTKKTVASRLLGESSRGEALLFSLAVKNWRSSRVLWSLWVTGVICGMLALMEWMPLDLVWCSLLMLPLPTFTVLVLSVDLVNEVLEQFEFYLITILQLSLSCVAVVMLQDRRGVFWCCLLPSSFIACFVDAYPPRFRRVFSIYFFSAFQLILIFWGLLLAFSWIHIRDDNLHFKFLKGRLAPASCSIVVTLNAFCLKHLHVAIRKPDHFVLIVGAIRTLRVQVRNVIDTEGNPTLHYARVDRTPSLLSARTLAEGPVAR